MSDPAQSVERGVEPHSICLNCDATFASASEASQHGRDTMEPTGNTSGVIAQGHTCRVVNQTPEEAEESRIRGIVDRAIDNAIGDAMEALADDIYAGRVTSAQVRDRLARDWDGFGFAEAWDEYNSDACDDDIDGGSAAVTE